MDEKLSAAAFGGSEQACCLSERKSLKRSSTENVDQAKKYFEEKFGGKEIPAGNRDLR